MEKIKSAANYFLDEGEKYLKVDTKYLARGGFWVLIGQIGTQLISFGLVIFFANFLSKDTYGLYRYILSLAGIFYIFTLDGMNTAVGQAVATGDEGALRPAVRYQLKWNLLMTLALLLLSGYYFLNNSWTLAISLATIGAFAPMTAAFNTYGAYLGGKKEFRLSNILAIISTLIYAVGMVVVVLVSGEVVWLILAYSLTTFLASFMLYLFTIHKFRPPLNSTTNVTRYGRQLTLIGLLGPVVSQIDKIILTHFWGPAQLAVYSLATAIPGRATSLIKDWVDIVSPKLAAKTPQEINRVFYKRIIQGLSIGLVLTIIYVIISPTVFKYLLPKYLDTVFYSQLLALSLIFAMPNRYLGLLFTAQKLPKVILTNSVTQNFIRLFLYIVLGVWGGILGLVWAQVINTFVSFVTSIIIWRRFSHQS